MRRAVFAASLLVLAAQGCGPGNLASRAAKPPDYNPEGQAKCSVAKSQSEPLIVEWPSAARARLEALSRKGVVVVSYKGCEMRVLGGCMAPGAYTFSPTTRKRDVVTITNADELYANIPVGAAKLEGKLQASGQLNVSMTIVGRYDAPSGVVDPADLVGDCSAATHVIAGLTTGAFKFFAGSAAAVGGSVEVAGVGAGGKSSSKNELLNEDGDDSSCAKSSVADKVPPDGCGAILRVEVVPLGEPKKKQPTCPSGTAWDGDQCVTVKTTCPVGTTWNGAQCTAPSVKASGPTPSPEPAKPKSLYERLGGKDAIAKVVDLSLKKIAADTRINKYFTKTIKDPKKLEALKTNLVDQICQATGGPCEYKAKDMTTAHKGMKIKDAEFTAFVEDVTAALQELGVGKAEMDELLGALRSMKPDIVEK